jgi:hypothetical protein
MAVSALQRLLKYQELDGPGTAAESSSAAADAHKHHHHHHHHHHGRRRGGQLWKLDAALWSERDVLQVGWHRLNWRKLLFEGSLLRGGCA